MIRVKNPFLRWLTYAAMTFCLLSITGCDGCWRQADTKTEEEKKKEQEEKKKKRPLPDIEMTNAQPMPGIISDPKLMIKERRKARKDPILKQIEAIKRKIRNRSFAKPGHWHDIRLPAIANNFDIQGTLTSFSASQSDPVPIPSTPYTVSTARPFALSKGEWKTFESSIYFPHYDRQRTTKTFMCRLRGPGLATGEASLLEGPKRMASFQHHVVLLTDNPDQCRFIEMAPTIKMPVPPNSFEVELPAHYIVIPSSPGLPTPLPRHSLNWTTIAYVIWDDLDPDLLDEDQQTAMLDWIHFGGQLIISGQESLERLENSFLGPYLPATAGAARELRSAEFAELNENWSLPEENLKDRARTIQVNDKKPVLGIELTPLENGQFVEGTGSLVAERQLGRGRTVATSFSLKSPSIKNWRSFDSFLHNALMRKKARVFMRGGFAGEYTYRWQNDRAHIDDPLLGTTLRYLSRDLTTGDGTNQRTSSDLIAMTPTEKDETEEFIFQQTHQPNSVGNNAFRELADQWHYGGYEAHTASGLGGWNDQDGVAAAARATLLDAAGIAPPSSTLVLQLLTAYLFVLVPLNWFVFWMMGRVEWAWIAAPLIAVLGAIVVIRMASLDIGFSRSNTQVCLLELQTGYERAHLTEYSALYTSLSTSYDIEMETPGAQSLPFPARVGKVYGSEERSPLTIDQRSGNSLKGVQIQSNSTQLIHSEQMVNIGGTIRLEKTDSERFMLINDSAIELQNVLVVNRVENQDANLPQGQLRIATVEKLAGQSKVALTFKDQPETAAVTAGMSTYFDPEKFASDSWTETFSTRDAASMNEIINLPIVGDRSDEYRNWFLTQESIDTTAISKFQFLNAYQELNPIPKVTLGRVLTRVDRSLTLPFGQFRLYASTPDMVGGSRIQPDSTQSDRQTLVVVHLTHPRLGPMAHDLNSPSDFGIESTFDRQLRLEKEKSQTDSGDDETPEPDLTNEDD